MFMMGGNCPQPWSAAHMADLGYDDYCLYLTAEKNEARRGYGAAQGV